MTLYFLLLVCLLSPVALAQRYIDVSAQANLSAVYPFNVELVEDSYWLYWDFNTTTQSISFAVRVRTTGWIGFGLSPNGQMPGSDVVIGWVGNDGTNYFHDRYAMARATPPIDPVQNWFLTNAEIFGEYTTLEFYRNFTTCDDRDLDILFQTAHVVYSWNDQKPTVNGPDSFTIVPHSNRGTTVVNLLGGLPDAPTIPDDAQTFTMAPDEVPIPPLPTVYWCTAARWPEEVRQNENYIIKFSPNITAGNEPYVYQIVIYECSGLQESDLSPKGGFCVVGVSERVTACTNGLLIGMIAGWAVGGIEFTYPSNVGFAFGGSNNPQFIVIETHYNNPNNVQGIVDSSGITFTYVSTRREHNAGILFLGHDISQRMVIPPNATNFTVTGLCTGSCTEQFFPPTGIHIFANFFHSHSVATGFSVRHLNETTCSASETRFQELKPIDRNLRYTSRFQQTVHLPEIITVLPGDTITLECYYRTVGRSGVTLGGPTVNNELCLTFPIYYPRVEHERCISAPFFEKYQDFVTQYVPPELQSTLSKLNLETDPGNYVAGNLSMLRWTQEQIDGYQRIMYTESIQNNGCGPYRYFNVTPSICCPYEAANSCTGFKPSDKPCCERRCVGDREVTTGASTVYISVTLVLTIVLMALTIVN